MKNIIAIILIWIPLLSGCAQSTSEKYNRFEALESEIENLLKEYHAAGLSIAIVEGDTTTYAKGFGVSNINTMAKSNESTIYGIGSCTKSFTASLLGILEQEGRLRMEDKPSRYITDLTFNTKAMNDSITIKHILSHGTGISLMGSESSCVMFHTNTTNDLIPRLSHLAPERGVGASFIYSNYMYGVAGVLSERITGASWHKNLSNMIFEPLSLDRTFSNVEEASQHSNFSIGYAVDASNIVPVLPEKIATRAPAGDVFSSVEDMAEWLKVWLNEGKHNGIQFLSPSYIESATSEVQLMNPATDSTSARHYGYGWMRSEFHGRKRVEHSGGVSGYSANTVLFPDDKLGIVVLVNQTGSGLAGYITEKFIAKLLDVEALDAADEPEPRYFSSHTIEPANTPTTLKSNSPTTVDLVAFEGSYFHPGFGQIDVIYDGNTLFAEFPFTKMRLEHQGGNLFFDNLTEEIPLMYWNFMRLDFQETNGTVNGILINFQADPVHFVRMKT